MDNNINQVNPGLKREAAKDLFLHLLSAATLYLSVVGFITLWWQYINFLFPDRLNSFGYGSSMYNSLLWANSVLVVSFPVYILISWIIGKGFKIDPLGRESRVRKWLWYITLFIAAMTMIIDMVTLVYNFLKGDLTTQFFLKLIVILAAAGIVFGYYLWDLRKRDEVSSLPKRLAVATGVVILASIIYGFILVGTPAQQRNIRFDEQRISELQQIQSLVVNYWQQKGNLPKDLNELSFLGYMIPVDPETSKQYIYLTTGDLSFKLCADFKTTAKIDSNGRNFPIYSNVGLVMVPQNWIYGVGNNCFDITIDAAFFKNRYNQGIKEGPNGAVFLPAN